MRNSLPTEQELEEGPQTVFFQIATARADGSGASVIPRGLATALQGEWHDANIRPSDAR
jgi:hypothetical protein